MLIGFINYLIDWNYLCLFTEIREAGKKLSMPANSCQQLTDS